MLPPKEFLKGVKPFNLLNDDELDLIIKASTVDAFEEGEIVFEKNEKLKDIYIIFSGNIGLYDGEKLIDIARKGDILALSEEISENTAIALEESICYIIPKKTLKEIFKKNKKFEEFFKYFEEREFKKLKEREVFVEDLFYKPIKEVIVKKPVTCTATTPIRSAVVEMELNKVGSIVVVDDEMKPIGILTNTDLRKFIIHGSSSQEPVAPYMSKHPICIESNKPVFEAYSEFLKRGINHLIITENGKVVGVVTPKDILSKLEPASSVIVQSRKILKSSNFEELKIIHSSLKTGVAKLALRGAHFYELSSMISNVYDSLVTKVIDLSKKDFENSFGKLPNFVWVSMGSAARREQIIAADQDNAIICEKKDSLQKFASIVNERLDEVGIPKCPGNYMASYWCKNVEEWKELFRYWFNNFDPESIRKLTIFLDMRPTYGDFKLFDEVFDDVYNLVTPQALRQLAHDAITITPPSFGLFKKRVVDIKKQGIYPITNAVRVLAFEVGIRERNTKSRIEKLMEIGVLSDKLAKNVLNTYEFLQDLRLKLQALEVVTGRKIGNEIDLNEMDKLEETMLKESFKIISDFQKFVKGKYRV
ncbi:MAG: DUF294 nucleotidyltransferase-like domain-containing protein [Archaeoglobaceae archaeon]|nr:DUF294 nucleotidyltransferase-like domain-containing protein [Archaeoglobaceae archaeon]MCX8151546.1 DUF294 nucleotidyltransferase-like domain-containing protein [Archaeoglobaceae archaeon]MDW8013218.1 putative nucleotidyltransferase substrate binding domain-containing protein [Archaeoglobaceae archaeon]